MGRLIQSDCVSIHAACNITVTSQGMSACFATSITASAIRVLNAARTHLQPLSQLDNAIRAFSTCLERAGRAHHSRGTAVPEVG
jgi:hypothetical protein